ncbi:MAG TPA: toxin TcdB middle/N-terminal domain-containing protein, partial [Luteimonas sp.]|nr:toxin TcdB middle/N-terminal domain-containing protein [Luteimonas sp.]
MTAYSRPGGVLVAADPLSDAVAATPAEFRVDESGAATYSVPLFTVPGTAGVAPQLSLNYSSQGGYGPMGRGWSVGGLSAISRCRATREAGDFLVEAATPDGNPRPINFTASDRFCLDGQRLIASTTNTCPAAPGMAVQELRTELESFQRVCVYQASSGTGPAFFTVERKDGSTSWYGDRDRNASANRPDGYFESTAIGQTTKALSWAQTRFQDSTGNTIDYHYLKNPAGAGTGEHLISEVRYTGKVALAGQGAPASDPFAKVVFHYAARAAAAQGRGYASGGLLTQSQQLEGITSCGTPDCAVGSQVRHYLLSYLPSPSGNGQQTLVGLQECRDTRAEVCASPTTFEWSMALHDFSTSESVGNLTTGSVSLASDHFRGYKLGDINGDGRPDLVIQYLAGNYGTGCPGGTWLITALGTLNGAGQPTFGNLIFNCVSANITSRGDGAWHLLDYNGDGRDDLFVSSATGTGWRVHPSNGVHFDMTTNLIAGLSPAIPSVASEWSQVQLADLNGDGLTDIVYPRDGFMKTRLMERLTGGFAWGDERKVEVDESTLQPPAFGCDDFFNPDVRHCQTHISGMPTTKTGFMQMTDLNGDAASDLLIRVTTEAEVWTNYPGCIREVHRGADRSPGTGYIDRYEDPDEPAPMAPAAFQDPCWSAERSDLMYGLGVDERDPVKLVLKNLVTLSTGNPHAIVFADTNGDGLSDPILRGTSTQDWWHRINNGQYLTGSSILPLTSYRDQARFVDVTGDGRADLLHLVNYGSYKAYAMRRAMPDGSFAASTSLPGNNARLCSGSGCNEQLRIPIFADFDGDGQVDFLSMDIGSANIGLYFSRSSQRFVPRDVIVRITNGFEAKTELAYAPLTNTAVYRRSTGARNGLTWGRGSPVADFLAPMYVVARASSSAPVAGNANAMASVYYRYANARVQAGGRGFLGFETIETIDPNQTGGHVVTTTTYAQNFPFVGMPMRTKKSAVSGAYTVPACLTGTISNACFGTPGQTHPDLGGSWFSDSWQSWEVAPASLASQAPLHVRTLGTEEFQRDPFTGAQTGKVATAFDYGAHGNVSQTIVDTYTGSATTPTATVITGNTYGDDVARWRLGRLTASTITHRRPGLPDVVRTTGFSYQMSGATTGLLTEERLQPGGAANLASAKAYQLDDYGNRLQSTTCAGPATPCTTGGMLFQPTTATHIRRYARVAYDERGRFPVATYEPFRSETGSIEARTSYVAARDAFGEAIDVLDVNNVRSYAVKGILGRDYYAWQQTTPGGRPNNSGVRSLTTYRTCAQVNCPAGAAFRQQVEVTAGPRKWTYFDVLGRPVLQAGETANIGVSGKDVSAACTDYDTVGRPRRVSNPFFLAGTAGLDGPTGLAGVCSAVARQWTVTTYDVLGRPVLVQAPDSSQASVGYAGLTTTKTDPRGKATTETRNGLGEVVAVTDAAGLSVHYAFDAAGNIVSVSRNAGAGVIANTFVYDVLGRKVQQHDPDTGTTSFEYNALGELTAQIDALGHRSEHAIDARGRIWRTTVKDFSGLTETESSFTFDTSVMGSNTLGQLTRDTISGTYAGWSGQPDTALAFDREHYFDPLGRPVGGTVQLDSQVFGAGIEYDALGRPQRAMDASGQAVKTEYGPRGHALALCATDLMTDFTLTCAGADTHQRTLETDAWGNVTRERRGNSAALEVARTVWADTGRVASICAGNSSCSLVNEQYGWDAAGNLSSHLKEQRYLETFTYDDLNRLSTGTLLMRNGVTVNQATLAVGYDALGNICSRNGTGYGYGASAGCSGAAGMAAMPVAVLQGSQPISSAGMPEASRRQTAQSEPRTTRAAVAWQVPAVWRERFAHHAPERSSSRGRDRDRDRPSFMDDDAGWGLAHGIVSDTGQRSTSFWSTTQRPESGTPSASQSTVSKSTTVSLMSAGSGGPHA